MNVYFFIYAEIQDGRQNSKKTILGKSRQLTVDTLGVKNFIEITPPRTVPEMYAFLHFTQKIKMAGKGFLRKITTRLCRYLGGQKFHRNLSISHHF